MTDFDVFRWTLIVYAAWRFAGIAWKFAAAQLERFRLWYNAGARHEPEPFVSAWDRFQGNDKW